VLLLRADQRKHDRDDHQVRECARARRRDDHLHLQAGNAEETCRWSQETRKRDRIKSACAFTRDVWLLAASEAILERLLSGPLLFTLARCEVGGS